MRQDTQQPASGEVRRNLYEEVTSRIISQLEQGIFPWVRPWDATACGFGLPESASTGKTYSGINILILWDAVSARGFSSHKWLTFRQAALLGGSVRKGEKGTTACYADSFIPKAERQRATETGEAASAIPFLKRFTLFNIDQCEGLPDAVMARPVLPERQAIAEAEAFIAATSADFRIGGGEAFYHRGEDYIRVPPQPAFRDQINYYRTCFHELGHWTGHPARLARDLTGRFGSEGYAREELVAEMTSAFICARLSILPTVRHADYLRNWLAVLRGDNRAIFSAASAASKAADFLIACQSSPLAAPVRAAAE
jgi:antirestriction protein ArdC